MDEQLDRLRSQVWSHLEAGEWHEAMVVAEELARLDASDQNGVALSKSARALDRIAEAIRLGRPLNDDALARLEKVALTWPRLAEARSFRSLAEAAKRAATSNRGTPPKGPPAKRAGSQVQVMPDRRKLKRGVLKRMARPKGWAGIAATVAFVLLTVLVCNLFAYSYLELQPRSVYGPERSGARQITVQWHGLIDLQAPVDTIILGDSVAEVDLLTGPIADRLGGSVINLGNIDGSSLLMDAWMLQYYLNKFGPPRNVILLRSCLSYELEHNLEFMSVVPLEWGYWDRLGPAPAWKDGEERSLYVSKNCVLYSDSDILASRLIHPQYLFSQPYRKVAPSRYYSWGQTDPSEFDSIRGERPAWLYGPFSPSSDSLNALKAMSDQARRLQFQLYIPTGPEWDEAYKDPDRQAKLSAMQQWLTQFTDPQYVHLVLSAPMVFQEDQMQNADHLRPSSVGQYTEAIVADIVSIQDRLAAIPTNPVQMTSMVLDKSGYAVGEKPVVTLSLTTGAGSDLAATVEGDVSCLVRPSGKSDLEWVARAPATAFAVRSGESTETTLTLNMGELGNAGAYDLIVFLRQNVGGLSYETRIELLNRIEVK